MRKLHESLKDHLAEIVALGELRPPTGRIEALNNNWETLVRTRRWKTGTVGGLPSAVDATVC